jgi:hypothetical protein
MPEQKTVVLRDNGVKDAMLYTQPHFMKSMKSSPYPELFGASGFLLASKACRLAFLPRAFLRAAGLACGGSGVFSSGVGTGIGT